MRVAAGTVGGSISWEVPTRIDLTGAAVGRVWLRTPTGDRVAAVALNIVTRQLTYTIALNELNDPGDYQVEVELMLSVTTKTERSAVNFSVYRAGRAPGL